MARHVPVVHGQGTPRRNRIRREEAAGAFVVAVEVLRRCAAISEAVHASAQVVAGIEHDDVLERYTCTICDAPNFFEAGGVERFEGWEVYGLDDSGRDG